MAAVAVALCLKAALEYASYGWRVVPLHTVQDGTCSCGNSGACEKNSRNRGKHPRIKKWQEAATVEEATIEEWFSRWPDSNVGVQMGPSSGIVDIETDSEEGEQKLAELFGQQLPVVPTFQSGRGKHRLFRWRDDLPGEASIPLGWGDVKLGSGNKGSQCVFPPSRHHSGEHYRWLIAPSEVDPCSIPDTFAACLWNRGEPSPERPKRSPGYWSKIGGGVPEGARNQAMTSIIGGLLRNANIDDAGNLELMYQAAAAINGNNKPPLDDRELKAVFSSVLKKERQRRLTEHALNVMPKTQEQVISEATKTGVLLPNSMKLVVIKDDPQTYQLYGPHFSRAPDGCIRLTAEQLCSFSALRVQALEQAGYPLPKSFEKLWHARGGYYEQLVLTAEHRDAPNVGNRMATAAEWLLARLEAATVRSDGKDEPDPRRPVRMSDGSVWFRWSEVWRDAVFGGSVDREQPQRVYRALGLRKNECRIWPHRGPGRCSYVVADKDLMSRLHSLAQHDVDDFSERKRSPI